MSGTARPVMFGGRESIRRRVDTVRLGVVFVLLLWRRGGERWADGWCSRWRMVASVAAVSSWGSDVEGLAVEAARRDGGAAAPIARAAGLKRRRTTIVDAARKRVKATPLLPVVKALRYALLPLTRDCGLDDGSIAATECCYRPGLFPQSR